MILERGEGKGDATMRRSLLLVVMVLVLLAMSAVPGVAAGNGAEKTEYYGCEVFGSPDFSEATMKYSGNTVHVRGLRAEAIEYIWTGNAWEIAGTNNTVWNINAKGTDEDPFFIGWSDVFLWGTFHIDLNQHGFDIGEYTGRWNLLIDDNPNKGPDTARGSEVDGKRLSKDDLDPDLADFPAASLASLPLGCGPIMFTIIDPGK